MGYRRDLQLSRRVKRHTSNSLTVRMRRLKTKSEIEILTLARVGGRGCGIYRHLARLRGASWSKEQGKRYGFEFRLE